MPTSAESGQSKCWTSHAPRSWDKLTKRKKLPAVSGLAGGGQLQGRHGAQQQAVEVCAAGRTRDTARCNRPLDLLALLVGGSSLLSFPVGRATQPVGGFWGKGAGSDH